MKLPTPVRIGLNILVPIVLELAIYFLAYEGAFDAMGHSQDYAPGAVVAIDMGFVVITQLAIVCITAIAISLNTPDGHANQAVPFSFYLLSSLGVLIVLSFLGVLLKAAVLYYAIVLVVVWLFANGLAWRRRA